MADDPLFDTAAVFIFRTGIFQIFTDCHVRKKAVLLKNKTRLSLLDRKIDLFLAVKPDFPIDFYITFLRLCQTSQYP